MTKKLPANPNNSDNDTDDRTHILNIGSYHYHGNDIKELRKLAEVNPELAKDVIDGKDRESKRAYASYKFGIASTVVLLMSIIASFSAIVVYGGVFESVIVVSAIVASALLLRVILTGKWSDDSFMGKVISRIIKSLGGSAE